MAFVNKICPYCKNPNYVVLQYMESIEDYSLKYRYKCLNCHKYFNDDDFKEEPPAKEGENVRSGMHDQETRGFKMIRNMKDCRDCSQWETCPCGKLGHDKGTSIGYSIGECKDYEPN